MNRQDRSVLQPRSKEIGVQRQSFRSIFAQNLVARSMFGTRRFRRKAEIGATRRFHSGLIVLVSIKQQRAFYTRNHGYPPSSSPNKRILTQRSSQPIVLADAHPHRPRHLLRQRPSSLIRRLKLAQQRSQSNPFSLKEKSLVAELGYLFHRIESLSRFGMIFPSNGDETCMSRLGAWAPSGGAVSGRTYA